MSETTRKEVSTVFTVDDKTAAKVQQMADRAEKLEKVTERARKSTEKVGGHRGGAGSAHSALSQEEQVAINEAKQERKLRRQRMLVQKVEMQKEQVLHRAADMALMAVIGEENHFAAALAKGGAMAQGMGASLAGFGGTVGKVGGMLATLGGYSALAGLAVSGISAVASAFGLDVEEAGHEIKKAAAHLIGRMSGDEKAQRMGFRNEDDQKAAKAMEERWTAESTLSRELTRNHTLLAAMPTQQMGQSMEDFHRKSEEFTKTLLAQNAELKSLKFEEVQKAVEDASSQTAASWLAQKRHQEELNRAEDEAVDHIRALPLNATKEAFDRQHQVVLGYVNSLVDSQSILAKDAAATAADIEAKLEHRGSVQNAIERFRRQERDQIAMDKVIEQELKAHKELIPPLHATAQKLQKINAAWTAAGARVAEKLGLKTEEAAAEMMEKIKSTALEKSKIMFDFRYGHYQITQQFAEGFDAGRVGVGLADQLSQLGETAIQSGFAPLYTVR